jgi:hypothetical protein
MSFWDKLTPISAAIAAVVVPLVLAYVGNSYTAAIKERELQGKFVELAINILKEKPTTETTNLRKWAIKVIDNYSGMPFNDATKEDLINRVPIPESGIKYKVPDKERVVTEVIISDTQSKGLEATLSALKSPLISASYHYLIDTSGKIVKVVDESLIAFHTAGHNEQSISIGIIHMAGEQYPPPQIEALAGLLADISKHYSLSPNSLRLKSEVMPRKSSDLAPIIDNLRDRVRSALAK